MDLFVMFILILLLFTINTNVHKGVHFDLTFCFSHLLLKHLNIVPFFL